MVKELKMSSSGSSYDFYAMFPNELVDSRSSTLDTISSVEMQPDILTNLINVKRDKSNKHDHVQSYNISPFESREVLPDIISTSSHINTSALTNLSDSNLNNAYDSNLQMISETRSPVLTLNSHNHSVASNVMKTPNQHHGSHFDSYERSNVSSITTNIAEIGALHDSSHNQCHQMHSDLVKSSIVNPSRYQHNGNYIALNDQSRLSSRGSDTHLDPSNFISQQQPTQSQQQHDHSILSPQTTNEEITDANTSSSHQQSHPLESIDSNQQSITVKKVKLMELLEEWKLNVLFDYFTGNIEIFQRFYTILY